MKPPNKKVTAGLVLVILLLAVACLLIWFDQPIPNPGNPPLLQVTFVEVGQGDAIILQSGDSNLLIDAGTNTSSNSLLNQIKTLGINHFEVVVGTHPHADHIGGMDAVINQFSVDKVFLPSATVDTKSFTEVNQAIQNKGLKISNPEPGSNFNLGAATITLIAPNSATYSDLNNYSIVLRTVLGSTSFLFTGDAEADSEKEMLAKGYPLRSDVLKVGHHGSNTSTSPDFLKVVSPHYAVISAGKDNDYGHPHQVTLDRLNAAGVKSYRTDIDGSVTFSSDGNNLKVKTSKE